MQRAPDDVARIAQRSGWRLGERTKKTPSVMPDLKAFRDPERRGGHVHSGTTGISFQPARGRAVFTGESANLGLCRRLAGAVRVAVQTGDPMGAIQKSGKEPAQGI